MRRRRVDWMGARRKASGLDGRTQIRTAIHRRNEQRANSKNLANPAGMAVTCRHRGFDIEKHRSQRTAAPDTATKSLAPDVLFRV